MDYDWVVVLNNQPVTELLVSPLAPTELQVMEQIAQQSVEGRALVGNLFAWQLGREDSTLYSNLRQGQRVSIPSESILFVTVMERSKKKRD